ncbi:MAG: hypothetical protein RR228_03815 [Bacilli bacterium]
MALKGVVLDAGHGGVDPGAVANNIKRNFNYINIIGCKKCLKS